MVLEKRSSGKFKQKEKKVDDYFSEAVWPVLAVARIFAIMPVSGLRRKNPKFKWFTAYSLFSLCYILIVYTLAFLQARETFNGKVNTSNSGGILFFISVIFSFHLFFIMARKWNKLILIWHEKEEIFLHTPYKRDGWYLSQKIRTIAAIFLGLAFSEYNHVFTIFPFSTFFAIFMMVQLFVKQEWISVAMAIVWNYSDIFIITVGIALSTRFKQLNNRIYSHDEMNMNYTFWSEVRQHYVLLCELLEIIDQNLAPLILLSCANNLYFICYQLVNIFDKLPDLLNYIYFWYSLILLIGRTIVMFLCISEIHDASKKPLEMIRKIRSSMWSTELERFSDQLTNETIALSGMNFFFITRKLVLGMVGTIITYELVLLQFDSKSDPETVKKDLQEFCNLK